MSNVVAFVLKGYPRLSETFIAQEILALERRGLDIRLVSLRHPTDPHIHPVHAEIKAPVNYLPEYLFRGPGRVWRAWRAVRKLPGYAKARSVWLKDLRRNPSPNRIRRFGQAMVLAHELPANVTWVHAHFLHTPASVARYAALALELPWSCSAHAKDIWTLPDWEKREKLEEMRWLVTCTKNNTKHLSDLTRAPDKVQLVYHGLSPEHFLAGDQPYSDRNGSDLDSPVVIVSVGRAVEKKGYEDLLQALGRLPDGLSWKMVHVGDGPRLPSLRKRAEELGIAARIDWRGAQPSARVQEAYDEADVFALASCIAADGDRDGLPNVLMEAQSNGIACISTQVSAIPELIIHGLTGLLVPEADTVALAQALERLITNPPLRRALGSAGRKRVRAEFDYTKGIDCLAEKFGLVNSDSETCESHFMLR